MIFATLGHPIDQKKLVDFLYSDLTCAPAPRTRDLTRILDNSWIDDRGVPFRSRIEAAFDQENAVMAIDDALIVGELMRKRPLLYANKDHCMVIVQADFVATPNGPRIVGMGALDPSPSDQPDHSPYRASHRSRAPTCLFGRRHDVSCGSPDLNLVHAGLSSTCFFLPTESFATPSFAKSLAAST